MEEEQISVSEQMERTSINISTFSALDEEAGMPLNFPNILGGEAIIEDETAKLKVEESFGQLNIQSLFGFETHTLQSVIYNTYRTEDQNMLTPNIYLLKSFTNDVYLLNYLATPYSDLDIDSYFKEVAFMSKALSGVFRRTNTQKSNGSYDQEKQIEIIKETVDDLVGYMHYLIFTERGLREMSNEARGSLAMIMGVFVEYTIDHTEIQCFGTCGKTYYKSDPALVENMDTCPECGGKLDRSPPILKMESFKFLYPPLGKDKLLEMGEEEFSPTKYIGYITGVMMPRNLSLTVNRLSPSHFGELVSIPMKMSFQTKDSRAYVQITGNYRVEGEKIVVFYSFSDSRFARREFEGIFVPGLSAITLNRDIVEGFEKGMSLDQIIRKSVINDWKLTDNIDFSKVGDYQRIDEMYTGGE